MQVEMLPSLASLPEGLQQALTMQEEQVGIVAKLIWIFLTTMMTLVFQASLIVRLGMKQSPVESLLSQVSSLYFLALIKSSHPMFV